MIGLLALSLATPLCAQGITSAALQGRVLQTDSAPIAGARVTATHAPSGTHWQVVTDAAGRYFMENVQVGGPYVLEAIALGFRPIRRTGIVLALGQRDRADFVLEPAAVELDALTVSASVDPLVNSGRTGPAHAVSATELGALPNATRDLSVAAALSPLAALRPLGGISIGGQNQGFNSFQVDGGVNADLYLGRTPGGASPSGALPEVLPHAISLETVSEFQVLAAPFDVRLGGFAGGLLNAVTKSGTNDFHGSAFGFLQSGRVMAKNAAGNRSDFTTWQFGGTLSGPIARNRMHFFLNADLQQRVVPDAGFLIAADSGGADLRKTGISFASAERFRQLLDSFQLDPGSLGPSDGHLPAQDVFAKITMQLGTSGHVEVSHHYGHGDRREFIDTGRAANIYALSSVAG
ncbi:MAG: carboxypeptidase regulatory-like domain-containing protein, partial [Gemmatimonadales bacterium]